MSETDHYGSLAEKYRFILQLAEGASVIVRGPYWTAMAADLTRIGLYPETRDPVAGCQPPVPGSALLLDLEPGEWPELPEVVKRVAREGIAVLLLRSRWSVALKAAVIRRRLGFRAYRLAEFSPVPNLASVEAFVSRGAPTTVWQLRQGRLRSIVTRLRRPQQQRFLFIADPDRPTGFTVAPALLQQATGDTGFRVERFHLRRRGALVIVLSKGHQMRRLMRVATNPAVARLVERNQAATATLLQRADLPADTLRLIPRPLGRCNTEPGAIFVEEYREGRLAWTLYRDPALHSRIDNGLFHFSHSLQRAARQEMTVGARMLEGLMQQYLDPLRERFQGDGPIGNTLHDIGQVMVQAFHNRTIFRTVGHGDYGLGNALALPDGTLSAVIDWDQFVPDDLPGVDWCDYRLKATHYQRSLLQALREMVADAVANGFLAPRHRGFGPDDFALTPTDLRLIPCLAALRELARSARFPSELSGEPRQYRDVLGTIAGLMQGAS